MVKRRSSFSSGSAIFVFDEDLRIITWNEGAERLTGIRAEEAIGRQCWEVVAGEDDRGGVICHKGCSRARLLREGRCPSTIELHARTSNGRRRLAVESIAAPADDCACFIHLMRDAPAAAGSNGAGSPGRLPRLTPRQAEILGLLAEGLPVKTVAQQLGLKETTVRNHVRLLLLELGAHSQLEAVARARAHQLL
jgi:PAS domain S-box-containing protein